MDVIPSIFGSGYVGDTPFFDGDVFKNTKLRMGEVKQIIKPTDPESLSKKYYEYSVLAVHIENGVLARRMYRNCVLINSLAGGGDHSSFALRESTKPNDQSQTDGSRVLLLCIEGSNNRAIIIGGLRDERANNDINNTGHYFDWEFNGVNFKVNDDGSWEVINKGKTDNLGKKHPKANNDGVGTTIKTEANGNIQIKTAKGSEIVIDNTGNKINIKADSEVTIDSDKVKIGSGASQSVVLGNELVTILQELIQNIMSINVIVAGVGSTPPLNLGAFAAMLPKLQQILSLHNKTS